MGAHGVRHRLRSELDEGVRDLRKGHATETGSALAIIGSNAWAGPDGTTVVEPTGRDIHEDDAWRPRPMNGLGRLLPEGGAVLRLWHRQVGGGGDAGPGDAHGP